MFNRVWLFAASVLIIMTLIWQQNEAFPPSRNPQGHALTGSDMQDQAFYAVTAWTLDAYCLW